MAGVMPPPFKFLQKMEIRGNDSVVYGYLLKLIKFKWLEYINLNYKISWNKYF